MLHPDQQVFGVGQLDEPDAHQRPGGQIEGRARIIESEPRGFGGTPGFGHGGQVGVRKRDRHRRMDHLRGRAVFARLEGGAQRLMACDERVERVLQRFGIEPSGELQLRRNMVGGIARLDLVKEPQTLLRRG